MFTGYETTDQQPPQHAVPPGEARALCGATVIAFGPTWLAFPGQPDPSCCPDCDQLAVEHLRA